jgi:hypothetical protein
LPGTAQDTLGEQQGITLLPGAIDRFAGQHCRVDVRSLEPLVPVALIIEDAAFDILVP